MSLSQSPQLNPPSVAENLAAVKQRMAMAAEKAARPATAVNLIAVSKTHDRQRILPALQAGHRIFGENRVQEAQQKWPALKDQFPDLALHLIGPLQSNKVRQAVALFDVIETVDRAKLAEKLAKEMQAQQRRPACFIQVNTGEEAQKAGIVPAELAEFVDYCRADLQLPIVGLMCIPPVDDVPALHFALLHKLAMSFGLSRLSMGMSADYEVAIALGATEVRVGTAIFGTRPKIGE